MKTTIQTSMGKIIYDAEEAKAEKENVDFLNKRGASFSKFANIILGVFASASLIALVTHDYKFIPMSVSVLIWVCTALAAFVCFIAWLSRPYYSYSNNVYIWQYCENGTIDITNIKPARNGRFIEPAELHLVHHLHKNVAPPRHITLTIGYSTVLCNDIEENIIDFTETNHGIWFQPTSQLHNNINAASRSYHELMSNKSA